MFARMLLAVFLAAAVLTVGATAQDAGIPDTCYFGDHGEAWTYPGDLVCVPVYFTTDANIIGVTVGIEYGFDGYEIHYDSVGEFGTVFMEGNYLSLTGLVGFDGNSDGVNPDSAGLGGAGFGNGDELPIGNYLFGKIWFSGIDIGDYLTVDSAYVAPNATFTFVATTGSSFTPQYVGGTLALVPGPAEIYVLEPDSVFGDAAQLLTFDVEVLATYNPASIVLDSVVKINTGEPLTYLPTTFGANPLTVEWTPTYEEFGLFRFWFTASDNLGTPLTFSTLVTVNWVQPPCDVLRGDADCNDLVNITDAVYLIQYIFNQGTPPGCEGDGL